MSTPQEIAAEKSKQSAKVEMERRRVLIYYRAHRMFDKTREAEFDDLVEAMMFCGANRESAKNSARRTLAAKYPQEHANNLSQVRAALMRDINAATNLGAKPFMKE